MLEGNGNVEGLLSKQRAEELKSQFEAIDLDKTGMIKATELTKALQSLNLYRDDDDIKEIVSQIDYHGNGMINYSEFIAATLSFDEQVLGEHLWMLFKKFDVDDTDQITVDNLEEAFKRQGRVKVT